MAADIYRRSEKRRGVLIAALGLAVLAVGALIGYLIWTGYQQAIQNAEKLTRNYASIFEARLDATLRRTDAELQELSHNIPLAALSPQAVPRYAKLLNAELRSGAIEFPEIAAFVILDAKGERLYTSARDGKSGLQYSDRSYYTQLRDNPQLGLVLSEVVISRATGTPTLIAARAIRDVKGTFHGIALATLEIGYFEKLFQSLDVGAGGIVAVYRSDNFTRVMRWPHSDGTLNQALPPDSLTRKALPPGTHTATFQIISSTDGIARVYSSDVLDRYPFFVSVGIPLTEVLASWRTRSVTVGVFGILLLTLMIVLLPRLWRVEDKLLASEELMRSTFEQAAVGIAHIEPDTFRILAANERYCSLLGYSRLELYGTDIRLLTPPEDIVTRMNERLALLEGSATSTAGERRLIRKDGTQIWVNRSLSLVRDETGAPRYYISVIEDITARRHAASERAYLAAIVDSSYDAIMSRDLNRAILSWNAAAERLFGYTAEEVLGKGVDLLIPPERAEEARNSRAKLMQGSAIVDLETVRLAKGGRRVDVSLSQSPIYDEFGKTIGVALTFRDISERKRKAALMQLLESVARATNQAVTPEVGLRACLERIYVYCKWDLGHVGLYLPGQTDGVTRESFWHSNAPEKFADFMRETDLNHHNRPDGRFLGVATRERRPVWIENIPALNAPGRLHSPARFGIQSGFIVPIFVDSEIAGFLEFFSVTPRAPDEDLLAVVNSIAGQLARLIERGRAGDRLAQLNAELESRVVRRTAELEVANKELNSFSYTIAHDMRAPVRAINGFSEMVLRANEDKLDAASVAHLRRVVAGSRHMGELIDDLLNLARLSRQEMVRRHFNLSELAATVAGRLADEHPARDVTVSVQPHIHVEGDPGLMRAVLENLIGNAWKFTSKTTAAAIEFGSLARDGETVYFVRDNGAGFDMKYAHKLFAPFQRLHHVTEFEGTGIGLATVKKIIERHGGRIWVDSALNGGTTAYFTIGTAQGLTAGAAA